MVMLQIAVLSLLIVQTLSAPTGCTELCSSSFKQYLTASNFPVQGVKSVTPLQGPEYSRPGTWNEHNDYNVDNGHGKVHEERGQYVAGPKTVRYYKKDYSSSYSTGYSNGEGLSDVGHQNNNYRHGVPSTDELSSQRMYDQMGTSDSIAQQHRYNSMQSQQHMQSSSIRRTGVQSERLEDFGERIGNSQALHQGPTDTPYYTNTEPGNWSKVDSYKTDGGNGRVFEEEGQYVSGAKKVRYFKKNYTTSYSSVGGVPEPVQIGVADLQKEIDKIHRNIAQTSSVHNIGASDTTSTNINAYDLTNLHSINNNRYRSQNNYGSSSSIIHDEQQQLREPASEPVPYRPSQNPYGTNSYSVYERHEGHVSKSQPVGQIIIPTSGYTNVLNTGSSGHSSSMYNTGVSQHQMDNIQQAEHLDAHQLGLHQNTAINSGLAGQTAHYKEHWSAASHTKESTVPQYAIGSNVRDHNIQYNNNQYENSHTGQALQQNSYMSQSKENRYNSAHQTQLGKLITGTLDLGQDTVDCDYDTQRSSQYKMKYKRSIKDDQNIDYILSRNHYNKPWKPQKQLEDMTQQAWSPHSEDFTQQTSDHDDLTQQTSGKLEFGQESQQSYQPWRPQSEDLTQQTSDHDDLTQQTSGKLEFGQESQQSYQPWRPQSEDLTQQTSDHDDLTQQTSGKLEFGQESQQSYQPWRPQSEDLTQQTSDHDDLTQQTSGKLEFGQQSYQPRKPGSASQQVEDLTQQTSDHDDLMQQTSGKLEFGQQSYQPRKPGSASQQVEDLTQQTSDHDDLMQQTSGKLEFGQQSYQPRKPSSASQQVEDLTQQTSDHDDLMQQTSGKLEFGQQSYQPRKPGSASQQVEDLTQQTGDHDDFMQQTSGKLEFGQQSYQPRKPGSASQQVEDLTQQTGDYDDFMQQTSGKLEFGQQSYQSRKPGSASQQVEDLTQQTGDHDDLMQQTSGKLEFGQQSYQPRRPGSASQQVEDLTQQTGDHDDLMQQTSGKFEFGQESQQSYQPWRPQSADLTQQTSDHDDLTQQTSGKLEFGQQSYQPRKPGSASLQVEDLSQQTDDHDDLTQQTSGKLQFGQQTYQPRKPDSGSLQVEDLTQQTGDHDDFMQQTSGKLEFGQQSFQPWGPDSASLQVEDLTQQTNDHDDLTQQTSGKFEFGQQSYQPRRPSSASQHVGDLTQQTGDHDDLTQQTSGKLEFGQQSYQPWGPSSASQHSEDLSQQTNDHDDLTQQTSGKLEFGQQSYQPWGPDSGNLQVGDLTQQTGVYDDFTQQASGKLEFGQQPQTDIHKMDEGFSSPAPKPAGKPKPRSRYARVGSVSNIHIQNQNMYNTNTQKPVDHNKEDSYIPSIYEISPYVAPEDDKDNTRSQDIRGDQSAQNSNKNNFKDSNQQTVINAYNIDRENTDQVNWLHKSNDATVGLQWHYTYHPSDHRQFVQQTEQKDKENLEQQTSQIKFSDLQQTTQQEAQGKYSTDDLYQQSSNQDNQATQLHLQPQDGQTAKYDQGTVNQQTVNQETDNEQKYIRSSETMHQLEPRILEAYGGGPYDVSHGDDIYRGITIKPSATLPPLNGVDPWDIREKPIETTLPPMPVEPLMTDAPTDVSTPRTFWSRIGHKITNTFDKAKEKARNIFG